MKTAFSIIVFLHGLIHLLGFVKAFGLCDIKALTLPISKPLGALWLIAALLMIVFGIIYLLQSRYDWIVGIPAVCISQVLIIVFWNDAGFGTIPNVMILLVSIASLGYYNYRQLVQKETAQLLNQNAILSDAILNETDIAQLPEPVKKWLRSSGSVGRRVISMGKVTQKAEMKIKPGQKNWMQATATQYTTIDAPAFIWTVDVRMNSLLSAVGIDKFENGRAAMTIKLNALVNIVNESGDKLNEGTLQRYLGEMVWFPSLAISPYITWEQLDENSAIATMHYKGASGSGNFYFNANGEVAKFSALRYKENEEDAKRYEWTMHITDYKIFEGIKVPSKMTSTWKLDEGDWTWLKLEVTGLTFNESVSL